MGPIQEKPLVVIVGETGSGKSALAMELAEQFGGEIISADSWAVYKGFNIGTAKPSLTEQAMVQHHLIDVADAVEGFNAALYKKLANQAIAEIHTRRKLPILVGGTGLYIDSVLFDFNFLPIVDAEERLARNALSLPDLLAEADRVGVSLEGIDTRNKRRVIRALEAKGERPKSNQIRPNTLLVGVHVPRDQLRARVTQRVEAMFNQGLEHEVANLAKQYGWETEPMKGIGYREWRDYFEGSQSLELTKDRIISATMNLAKRQRTWFKRNNSIQWLNNREEAVDLVTTFLNK